MAPKGFGSAGSKRRHAIDLLPSKHIGSRHSRFVWTDGREHSSPTWGHPPSHDFVPEMGVAIYPDNRWHTKAPVISFVSPTNDCIVGTERRAQLGYTARSRGKLHSKGG